VITDRRLARWIVAAGSALLALQMPTGAASAAQDPDVIARVVFAGRPVPGAVVVATRGSARRVTASDADGLVRIGGLEPGSWDVTIEMTGFEPLTAKIVVPVEERHPTWALRFSPIVPGPSPPAAGTHKPTPTAPAPAPTPSAIAAARPRPAVTLPDPPEEAADGFLVNGSVNNAAASPFAQPRGFGNNRPQAAAQYTGSLGLAGGSSRLDSKPYSFGVHQAPAPDHTDIQVQATIGGPLKPWFRGRNAPRFVAAYQGSTRQNASAESLLVPSGLERLGDFSRTLDSAGAPVAPRDPVTGEPFAGGRIPPHRISPQAAALLRLYPEAGPESRAGSNFEAPVTSALRQHDVQARVTHAFPSNIFLATLAVQRTRLTSHTAFAFENGMRTSGIDGLVSWNHRFSRLWAMRFRYQHTRLSRRVEPFFAGRVNVSGDAGIGGNDQAPVNWGPPRLVFPDIASLGDVAHAENGTITDGVNVEAYLNRTRHTITFGGDVRFQRQSVISQQDARGTFTFTGSATGVPFADFLLGIPATSAIGTGNADKEFRSRAFTLYVSDDARIRPTVTVTMGVRWEYDTPFQEARGRLANLDIAPDFAAAATLTSRDPIGPVTGRRLPRSLVTRDVSAVQPRVAVAWRPIPGSPLTIRAGFGVYRNPGLYDALATVLSQQPPFSRSVVTERSADEPITLADGFPAAAAGAAGTFAVDPDVRPGYVRSWQVAVLRDLPASMHVSVSYFGAHGRRLLQQILPNSYPPGASNPCPACPSGFIYLSSTGQSSRHAMQVQIRRRLVGGLAASAQYTFARAMDDAATFSGAVPPAGASAQDWRRPEAEWAPSSFDQRHVLTVQAQYTIGASRGASRLTGWTGALIKGWTVAGDLGAGSGLPFTPVLLVPIPGTGRVGVRPDVTGAPVAATAPGRYANPEAFAPPARGSWGAAGRHSIRGPAQFRFDLGLSRAFAWGDRRSVELRVDATNVLNRVTFANLYTTVGSPLFGFPSVANPMRKILTSLRVRF
jgi:hypothetical protein